ncbi:hypothetical protein PAPYR_1641 [Paratrimastix pyriformis]|uniref:TRAF-type domain-containing protein n=1 Tax=Paratrimastix pyriformis TaxID=342808 RepID=A0ABQ8UV27_9EUKA|nr:hypothetical protein PAPYR_1641 [Paratrimastix pyriformis]
MFVEVMRKAVTLLCEGSHKACQTCTQKWVKEKSGRHVPCPCCKQVLPAPHFHRDPIFDSLIQSLPVHCPQHPCEWRGKLEDLTRHQTQECGQRVVDCPHVGCPHRCPASALPGHLDRCEWKLAPCEKCRQLMPRKSITDHLATTCPVVEVSCPGCHQSLQRARLAAHWDRCPKIILPCPVPSCCVPVARGRLAKHLASSASHHVTCLSKALDQEREVTRGLKQSLMALRTKVDLLQLSPAEVFDILRQRGPRTLERTATEPGFGSDDVTFELRARVAIRVVGLGLHVREGQISVVRSHLGPVPVPLVDEGWTRLGASTLPPASKDPVPVLFREPIPLDVDQSITLGCSNIKHHVEPFPGNADIDLMSWVGWTGDHCTEGLGFAGKIFYALQ